MRVNSLTLLPLFAAALWACDTGTPASNVVDGDVSDATDATSVDSGGGDAETAPLDTTPDEVEFDVDAAIDTEEDSIGDPGTECTEDGDCDSGICVDIVPGDDLGGYCSSRCTTDEDCPADFDCIFVAGSSDTERVCVPVDLCVDRDGDRHGTGPGCDGPDCDDETPSAYAGANEVCDDIDNDCDGIVDDATAGANENCDTGFLGQCAAGRTACDGGLVVCNGLAVPTDESCDTLDNDCDGAIDEDDAGLPISRLCYDGDPSLIGTGVCAWGTQTCQDGGFSGCLGQQLPEAELCNGLDDDCNGASDDALALADYYADFDDDGFGDRAGEPLADCSEPVGYVDNADDCNDADGAVRPTAAEVAGDNVDQNCDGAEFCYEDNDGDGYRRDSAATIVSADSDCNDAGEASSAAVGGDCDDDQAAAYPANPEICDSIDNDCDRRVDEAAACYPNGDACVDPADCASGLCESEICVRPLTCVDLGTCPPRFATGSGGGRFATGRFILEVAAASGTAAPVRQSTRFRLNVGPSPYVTDP